MLTPEFMPILSAGSHDNPKDGACVMEMASFLAGEKWSDRPSCTHPLLARAAQVVNDKMKDGDRQSLLALLPRLMGTSVGAEDRVLSVRLAAWCARFVLPLARDGVVALAAVEAAEAWAGCPCDKHAAAAAYAAYAYTADAYADAAAYAADAAAAAAYAADAAYAANAAYAYTADAYAYADAAAAAANNAANNAAANAAYTAAAAATAANLTGFLAGLCDEYDRLVGSGRTTTDVTDADLERIREHITA